MRRTMTAAGSLTLLALFVLGVFSAGSASAGGGPSSVFLWTGPLQGLVLALSDNPQIFELGASNTIECKHFRGHGVLSNGNAMTAKEFTLTGTYTTCIAFGFAQAAITPVQYVLRADGSLGVVTSPIVITLPEMGCSIKINNGAPNDKLRLILYLNLPRDVLAHLEIKNITALGSGGSCGEAGVEKAELGYRGLLLLSVHGGTIQWDAK